MMYEEEEFTPEARQLMLGAVTELIETLYELPEPHLRFTALVTFVATYCAGPEDTATTAEMGLAVIAALAEAVNVVSVEAESCAAEVMPLGQKPS